MSGHIVVIARPGSDRRSLAALLKTLDRVELFVSDGRGTLPRTVQSPDLVLVDLEGFEPPGASPLARAAGEWPSAPRLALVADIRQSAAACHLGADCALARTTPAGELLQTVRRLSAIKY